MADSGGGSGVYLFLRRPALQFGPPAGPLGRVYLIAEAAPPLILPPTDFLIQGNPYQLSRFGEITMRGRGGILVLEK